MLSLVERLQVQIELLRDALVRLDWEAVDLLDNQSRMLVREVAASESWSDRALHEGVTELSRLYAELQHAGRTERTRLANELTRLKKAEHVHKAYAPLH